MENGRSEVTTTVAAPDLFNVKINNNHV